MQRRLSTILIADIAGYSRHMEADEEATIRVLQSYRQAIDGLVATHQGRIFGGAGDSIAAEFSSTVQAVRCAVSTHKALESLNQKLAPEHRMQLRVGINLGDVIVDGENLLGDCVNVAARLESFSDPGGIALSHIVYDQVKKTLALNYVDMGEQQFKNLSEPMRVFKVDLTTEHENPIAAGDYPGTTGVIQKNSIAILPFVNMSTDPEQDYFSDGISEDIIAALSKVSDLIVVARSSTAVYKGKSVDVKRVGREQGVRYVLEGSVRKANNRVRVTAKLIDAVTGHHVWADRYDRELDDIFAVQDELMREIVIALDVELRDGEQHRVWSHGTNSVEAWKHVRMSAPIILGSDRDRLPQARQWLEQSLQLDPDYAVAWVMMGWYHQNYADVAGGLNDNDSEIRTKSLKAMHECAQRAIAIDAMCADAYSVLAQYHLELGEFDAALDNAEQSVSLAPRNAENLLEAAVVLTKSGDPHRALEIAKRAAQLCPGYRAGLLRSLALAYRFTGNPEAAVDALKEAVKRQPDRLSGHVNLTSVLGELGRLPEAKAAAMRLLSLAPKFSISEYRQGLRYRNSEDLRRVEEGLRRANLPE